MSAAGAPARPVRVLVAKLGLDGHDRGAKVVAHTLRDAGMEVVYTGLRRTARDVVSMAVDEDVDVIGLSILSGSHLELVPEIVRLLREEGVDAPVVVGGIIPEDDQPKLAELGIAAVYMPKDYSLSRIMSEIADLAEQQRARAS